MKIKKLIVLIILLNITFLTSCTVPSVSKTYNIVFETNGGTIETDLKTYDGTCDITLPIPEKVGYQFVGWYSSSTLEGEIVTEILKGDKGNKTFYAAWELGTTSKWDLNKVNFNGNGIKFKIVVDNLEEVDPLNVNYKNSDKALKQAHLKNVETAYNIDIEYIEYEDDCWSQERVEKINEGFLKQYYLNENIYVLEVDSLYISDLIVNNVIASLDIDDDNITNSYFKNVGYNQNHIINKTASSYENVYIYNPEIPRGDYFLYYNATKVKELNLEDPSELWLKGLWNESKFDEWLNKSSSLLSDKEYVIDCDYDQFSIGYAHGIGNWHMIFQRSGTVKSYLGAKVITDMFSKLQEYYKLGYWNDRNNRLEISEDFINGKSIMHSGDLTILENEQIDFEIGVVPYPITDQFSPTIYNEPYEYLDSSGNKVKIESPLLTRDGNILKDENQKAIYGVDYSTSGYHMPYINTEGYSFLNFSNSPSGMNSEIAFNVVYDLTSGLIETSYEKNISIDEQYRMKIEKMTSSKVNVDVIMSVKGNDILRNELVLYGSLYCEMNYNGEYNYWKICKQILTSEVDIKALLEKYDSAYQDVFYLPNYGC